ncbi:ABC transporter substrate-binding protein [Cryobacterium aureum]|uniref:ABC transporter substrate-binding protein n=1 Tax=Cryobacterium aureum TaxID=995037 RepID=UPI001374B1F9|nr:peptide ABC transporter substrate-binding protein [Cryobacterium aureum]
MRYLKQFVAISASLVLLGQGTVATAATVSPEAVMRVNLSGTIDSLNPFTASNQAALNVLTLQYESLARSGPDGTNVPDLASDWTVDDTVWTYHLQPDLKWSDGEPLTSKDVIWTLNEILTNPALATQNGSFVDSIDTVSAPDADTVEIVTMTAQATNPAAGLMIVPEHIWSDIAEPDTYENTDSPVGSGPYVLESYERGGAAIMKANPEFWRGAPALDGVHFIVYKNTDAAIQALRTGELDLVGGMTTAQYDSLEGVDGITQNEALSTNYSNLSVNSGAADSSGNPIGNGSVTLQDPIVRQAMRQAIDQQMLVDRVLGGHGSIGAGIIPPGRPNWYWDDSSVVDPYSPDEANASLDAAGYTMGADGIRLGKDGNPIQIRMSYNAASTANSQSAEFLQSWFKGIGIGIIPQPTDWDQMSKDLAEGTYDTFINGWGVGIDPDYMLSINLCSARPATAGADSPAGEKWCDPEFDRLYLEQHSETDEEKRKVLVDQAIELQYTAAVAIILYYPNPLQAYRSDHVTNLTPYAGDIDYYWAYADAEPVASVDDKADSPARLLPVGIGGGVLVAALAIFLIVRRRKTAADRE